MRFTRRQFLKGSSAGLALAGSHVLSFAAARQALAGAPSGGRVLVMINLSGGNDPLNTLIPLNDTGAPQRSVYEAVRPDLAVPLGNLAATEIDPDPVFGNAQALHPEMTGLKSMYDEGKLAIVNGVGYPSSSLSHFEAEAVWWAGQTTPTGSGWVGRTTDAAFGDGATRSMSFGSQVNPTLIGNISDSIGVRDITRFSLPDDEVWEFHDLASRFPTWQGIFNDPRPPGSMLEKVTGAGANLISKSALFETIDVDEWGSLNGGGESGLADDLQQIASILRHDEMNVGSPQNQTGLYFFHTDIGGFDTHSEQGASDGNARHPTLLRRLSDAMTNFQRDLEGLGLQDRVITLTYSEFGRRIAQNDSGNTAGTDHGVAGLMFCMGDATVLNGGVYGQVPDLSSADSHGNLAIHTDFRDIYAAVIDQWLGEDHTGILGGAFAPPALFV